MTTNGSTTSYAYDGWGRRVKKTTGATVTGFLWDGDDLYADLDASQNPTAEYAFYPGIDQPHSVRKASFTYYYASELPGHVSGLFYGSTVSDSYRYTPWGLAEGTASTGWNRLRYMGREWDSESSLYYVRNRYYDPQLRRFISEDPIGLAGGINRYTYVGNDPINGLDPSGLGPCVPFCALSGLIARGISNHWGPEGTGSLFGRRGGDTWQENPADLYYIEMVIGQLEREMADAGAEGRAAGLGANRQKFQTCVHREAMARSQRVNDILTETLSRRLAYWGARFGVAGVMAKALDSQRLLGVAADMIKNRFGTGAWEFGVRALGVSYKGREAVAALGAVSTATTAATVAGAEMGIQNWATRTGADACRAQ